MKRLPDHVKAAYEQCEKLGVLFSHIVLRHKIVGTIVKDGKKKVFYMAKTPSDYNAPWRVMRDVRRYVREMSNENKEAANRPMANSNGVLNIHLPANT